MEPTTFDFAAFILATAGTVTLAVVAAITAGIGISALSVGVQAGWKKFAGFAKK